MRLSQLFFSTYKEEPNDAVVASHKLMHRAGYIIKSGTGLYHESPLLKRVIEKTEAIIRDELNKAGCQEIQLSVVTPASLWQESGRWDEMGDLMLKFEDRLGRDLCISPTNEEAVVDYFRSIAKSYKQLPVTLYQINTKFRDEIRPRFGLMRAREFSMKDAYSFHMNKACLDETYDKLHKAYSNIFSRLGLEYIVVEADGGAMAGSGAETHEFQVVADSGEDDIVVCKEENYASNVEAASTKRASTEFSYNEKALEMVHTPGHSTIADVCEFLDVKPEQSLKALVYKVRYQDGEDIVLFMCLGDDNLNELKAKKVLACLDCRPATEEEIKEAGLHLGYIGPINAPSELKIILDNEIDLKADYVCGANEKDEHFKHVVLSRDLKAEFKQADIRLSKDSDVTKSGNAIEFKRGIEVGHIFQLGDKYTKALNATVLDENGKATVPTMGCYGIGVGRTVAAAIEQKHDDKGIVWPLEIAPYHLVIVVTSMKDEALVEAGERLFNDLKEAGVEVLLDDRNVSAGVKFKDADLMGMPYQVVIGKLFKNETKLELIERSSLSKKELSMTDLLSHFKQ